jgi:hypothetical protein
MPSSSVGVAATLLRAGRRPQRDGPVSRDSIADACMDAFLTSPARTLTFEVFDDPGRPGAAIDWPCPLAQFTPEGHAHIR